MSESLKSRKENLVAFLWQSLASNSTATVIELKTLPLLPYQNHHPPDQYKFPGFQLRPMAVQRESIARPYQG